MSKLQSTPVAVLTAIVLAAAVGLSVQYTTSTTKRETARIVTGSTTEPAPTTVAGPGTPSKSGMWAASAPGRVEPKAGEVRIGTQVPGRVAEVLVSLNDKVVNGDLMVRLDDDEAQAKLTAAESEVAVRKRERDAETVGRLAQDRRNAEDAVASAERGLFLSRRELDRTIAARRANTGSEDDLVKARTAVTTAKDKLDTDRLALRKVQGSAGMPLPTRLESGLSTARAELSSVEIAIERTRIRAAGDGTVLQVSPKVGEIVAPSPELVLVVLGDLTGLRVRAEVEERDVSKVRVGQKAVIRTDAYPGREFKGTIASLGQSLAPPRLTARGPRKPTDVDALEVLIDVDAPVGLMPGMRADVFFLPEATAQVAPAVKTN